MSILVNKLVEKKIFDKSKVAALEEEMKISPKREEEIILEKKLATEDEVFKAKAELLGYTYKKVDVKDVPLNVLELIPEESAKLYEIIPVGEDTRLGVAEIGMIYPDNPKAQEVLRFLSIDKGFKYKIVQISISNFSEILSKYKSLKQEVSKALGEIETEVQEEVKFKKVGKSAAEISKMAEEAPISRIVASVLKTAVEGKASDIHIEPTFEQLKVRFRKDGVLFTSILLPKNVHPAVVARIKILSDLKIDESRLPQDGRFSLNFEQKRIDFRVSTFPASQGESVCMRILDPDQGIKKIANLGLMGPSIEIVESTIDKPYGMILVTGPTGSGKTTTLYALLQKVDREKMNVMTMEDPVEYVVDGINQSQVKSEIGYTFAAGLRSMLRHDPDIIMVGEIRDHETADLAVHSALTGHLVLSTLHTNDSIGAIPRLINLGIPNFLVSPSLNIIIAQRLVRKLCPLCKQMEKAPVGVSEMIQKEIATVRKEDIAKYGINLDGEILTGKPVGCKECNNTGYSGRIGIYEVFSMSDDIAQILAGNPSEDKIREVAQAQGMISMRQDGFLKVILGVTSLEEVISQTKEGE